MKSYMKKIGERGFTLIELLVVIAIIGILSSVVLASLNGARESARDSRRQSDLQQIRTAASLYANTEGDGQYPAGLYGTGSTDLEGSDAMSVVPVDPDGSTQYGYAVNTGSGNWDVCIGASLESDNQPDNHATQCPASVDPGNNTTFYAIAI